MKIANLWGVYYIYVQNEKFCGTEQLHCIFLICMQLHSLFLGSVQPVLWDTHTHTHTLLPKCLGFCALTHLASFGMSAHW